MIRFDTVGVRYPRATRDALSDVSLQAARGELTAIVGPNGSGKSTLIRALIGRVDVARGGISIDEIPVSTLAPDERARRVAVVTQREDLAFALNVREYVSMGRFPYLGMWRVADSADLAVVDTAMSTAGVGPLRDRPVDALSGGEWQRVRLARALAQDADGLVFDEPTTFLDIGHEMAVFELLHELARAGHAVLVVSHHLNLVARFADRMVLLHHGVVTAAGSPADVMRADVLGRVYEWPIVVREDALVGALALVPLRSAVRPILKTRARKPM
jgi:iron complex transport system ATP-binding protein